jgi:hypothetical protein
MAKVSSRPVSLLDSFRALGDPTKNMLADIDSPLLLGLLTLTLAADRAMREYLSLEHMVAALEAAGIGLKRVQLGRALARAGNRVSRKMIDGEPHYKIMIRGRRDAEQFLQAGNLSLLYVEGRKPRTDRRRLGDILSDLSGTVRICDPFYGVRTLDTLELIPDPCSVRFLTAKTNENITRLSGPIRDFRIERPRTELRLYPKSRELHDRYILGDDRMLIVGHGLKDIGSKESFVIAIKRALVPDLHAQVTSAFNDKWSKARPL